MLGMLRTVLLALFVGVVATSVIAADPGMILGQRHSCGYKCNPDGSRATPSAPAAEPQIQLVGRTNPHSGGREGGAANKRVGHPGGPSHPNGFTVEVPDAHMLAVDGFGRNRGTRPHHPRASCRCVHGSH